MKLFLKNNEKWQYRVGGVLFTNKLEAIDYAQKMNKDIEYLPHIAHEFYDYTTEPQDAWPNILAKYARAIREHYDYIKIWFSGGCDSRLVLDTFVKNKIYIDEIVIFQSGFELVDYELDIAKNYLKLIKNKLEKTKINIVTKTIDDWKNYYKDESWIYTDSRLSTGGCFREPIIGDVTNYNKSKTVDIIGKDKPYIMYQSDIGWFTLFSDVKMNYDYHSRVTNNNICYFFADFPEIHAKQCHMLKTYLENKYPDTYNKFANYKLITQDEMNQGCGRLIYHTDYIPKIIYDSSVTIDNITFNYHNHKDKTMIEYFRKKDILDLYKRYQTHVNEFTNNYEKWLIHKYEYSSKDYKSKIYKLS